MRQEAAGVDREERERRRDAPVRPGRRPPGGRRRRRRRGRGRPATTARWRRSSAFEQLRELDSLAADLRDLALVIARTADDDGRRTPLDDVAAAFGG